MGADPVKLGTILFTLVEPHRGHEVAYNRWYERDHFYAGCMVGPWCFAGRRFVATRACKDLRYPDESPVTPDRMTGSYLGLYWILDGHHDEWNRWAVDQVIELHAAGRMFAERDHTHTLLYRYEWGAWPTGDGTGVPAELALDHPFAGLVAVIGETHDGVERTEVEAWHREAGLPSGAGACLSFSPLPLLADAPGDVPRTEGADRRFLDLFFLEDEPFGAWDDAFGGFGEAFEKSGLGRVLWASPFVPTIPGTDTYADELW